jgi:hypothetical protein
MTIAAHSATKVCLAALLVACSSHSQTHCEKLCAKLTSCPNGPSSDECTRACAQQPFWLAGCQSNCLSLPGCADFTQCLEACIPRQCVESCDACSPTQVCFGGGTSPDVVFDAVCLQKCNVTGDCLAGYHCVEDDSDHAASFGRVCMPGDPSATIPARCITYITVTGCSGPHYCADADTLRQPFFGGSKSLCGEEFSHCDAGCEGPTLDGGPPDGGIGAHCK